MKRWLSHPAFWLVAQPLVVAVWLWSRGLFIPNIVGDTQSYEGLDWTSISSVLSGIRPFGYPLFLRVAALLGDGHRAVPVLHFVIHVVAVWIFFWGLRQTRVQKWTSFWAASALFYSHNVTLQSMVSTVFADPLALSLAIASAGSLLAAIATQRVICWIAVALLTFLTYVVQPAYLFVILLWPLVAILLLRFVVRRDVDRGKLLRFSAAIIVATVLPFVLFCATRWLFVGHFGLVSFGGYNVIGVAGQLLDESTAQDVPDDLRPLATSILQRRERLSNWESPDSFLAMERTFNPTVWDVSVPAARQLYDGDAVKMNQQLTRLSFQILARHPGAYLRWLVWNVKHGLIQLVGLLAKDKATLVCFAVLLLTHFKNLIQRRDARAKCASDDEAIIRFTQSHLLLWLALGFAVGKLLLVVLVEPANDRYMTGAMVFLPAAFVCCAANYVGRVWGRGIG
jgi:hypothetical protein